MQTAGPQVGLTYILEADTYMYLYLHIYIYIQYMYIYIYIYTYVYIYIHGMYTRPPTTPAELFKTKERNTALQEQVAAAAAAHNAAAGSAVMLPLCGAEAPCVKRSFRWGVYMRPYKAYKGMVQG